MIANIRINLHALPDGSRDIVRDEEKESFVISKEPTIADGQMVRATHRIRSCTWRRYTARTRARARARDASERKQQQRSRVRPGRPRWEAAARRQDTCPSTFVRPTRFESGGASSLLFGLSVPRRKGALKTKERA